MPDCVGATITPESKLGEVLAQWPVLEEKLLELSPHFKALQNPVLRRTVAKVATLRQASRVSGVPLGRLVDHLRAAAASARLAPPTAGPGLAKPDPDGLRTSSRREAETRGRPSRAGSTRCPT